MWTPLPLIALIGFSAAKVYTPSAALEKSRHNIDDPCLQPANRDYNISGFFYFDDQVYDTPSHLNVSIASVAFDYTNYVIGFTTNCNATSYAFPNYFDGKTVFTCDDESVTFSYNKGGDLTVKQEWICYEKDYTALGYTTVGLQCVFSENGPKDNASLYYTYNNQCSSETFPIQPTNFTKAQW